MDARPALWVGHVVLATHDLGRSLAFYRELGCRQLRDVRSDDVIVELELRGGTHLVLVHDPAAKLDGRAAPFDLMTEDLDAAHAEWSQRDVEVSAITRGGHDFFTFRDPDGYVVTVNNTHVEGAV